MAAVPPQDDVQKSAPSGLHSAPVSIDLPELEPPPDLDEFRTPVEARRFLERLREKMARVVQDFTQGLINQRQFDAIYSHYQRQRIAVEQALIEMPGSGAWRAAAVEGHTSFLRQQHAATVLAYAIYETANATPIAQVGDLNVAPALLASLLADPGHADDDTDLSARCIELENGRFLGLVPGQTTALVALFSTEPATLQLQMIQDLHRDFEMLSETSLDRGDVSQLARTFINLWSFEQGSVES